MQRLSGLDAGFLYMETPTLHMHTLKLALLDPPPDGGHPGALPIEWLRDRVAERLDLLPPLRRRVVDVPWHLHHPVWIDDPDFAIEHHVRRVTVPAPGGRDEMHAVISDLAGRPLLRSRPLWELHLLDGLADGRIGILVKLHHALADGGAVAQLLANVMSTAETDIDHRDAARAGSGTSSGGRSAWRGEPVPAPTRLLRDALVDHARQLRRLPPLVGRTVRNGLVVLRHRRSSTVSPPRPMLDAPRTPLNGALTADRVFVTTTLPLDQVRRVRASLDVTVNDVVLAVVGGALRTYLTGRGALPPRPLVAAVPIGVDAGTPRLAGNKVANLFTTLATDDPDVVRRVRRIHDVTAEAKELQHLLGVDLLQEWVEYTPPAPYTWLVRLHSRLNLADHHPPPINVVVSNVPGPSAPLFAAGARLAELYSVGPVLEGVGVNVTVWSYVDRLHVGILGCPATLPDAPVLARAMGEALAELVEVAARLAPADRAAAAADLR